MHVPNFYHYKKITSLLNHGTLLSIVRFYFFIRVRIRAAACTDRDPLSPPTDFPRTTRMRLNGRLFERASCWLLNHQHG